jgi:hypothetical protein
LLKRQPVSASNRDNEISSFSIETAEKPISTQKGETVRDTVGVCLLGHGREYSRGLVPVRQETRIKDYLTFPPGIVC